MKDKDKATTCKECGKKFRKGAYGESVWDMRLCPMTVDSLTQYYKTRFIQKAATLAEKFDNLAKLCERKSRAIKEASENEYSLHGVINPLGVIQSEGTIIDALCGELCEVELAYRNLVELKKSIG